MVAHPLRFVKSAYGLAAVGGDEGIRTPGLLRAREALSQLSYIPLLNDQARHDRIPSSDRQWAASLVIPLWAILDLNQRPFPYQRNALAD